MWKICLNELAYAFSMNSLSLDFTKVSVKKPTVQKNCPKSSIFPSSWFCFGIAEKASGHHLVIIKEIWVTVQCF